MSTDLKKISIDSAANFQQGGFSISYHTYNVLLHYLVKNIIAKISKVSRIAILLYC